MSSSMILNRLDDLVGETDLDADVSRLHIGDSPPQGPKPDLKPLNTTTTSGDCRVESRPQPNSHTPPRPERPAHTRQDSYPPRWNPNLPSPLRTAHGGPSVRSPLISAQSTSSRSSAVNEEGEYTDERARDITHGRLVHGHIVPDDYPESTMSSSVILERADEDPMETSRASSFFKPEAHALGGTGDAAASSDEEGENPQNPSLEQMITLVGDVKGRTVFIVDDMIDKAGSWIAAAETVVKRGGAKKVYIIATHGLFGGDTLEELQNCDCIDTILVTNSFPIPVEKAREAKKLVVLDLSNLLAEAIRRNHYGESISVLFSHSSN